MIDREPMPISLRVASLSAGLFTLLVYGGFVVVTDGVPGWIKLTQLVLALVLLGLAAIELKRHPEVIRSGRGMLIVAAVILVISVVAVVVSALS